MKRLSSFSIGRRRRMCRSLLCAVAMAGICSSHAHTPMTSQNPPSLPQPAWNLPSEEERERINALLAAYTSSVSDGDAKRFESLLLDLKIPFAGVRDDIAAGSGLSQIQDYAGFRKSIFESGKKFKQRFSHIKIEQVGSLAQVSLDYETALKEEDYAGKGWKVIHLLKVDGHWKITSEFFTRYPSP